MLRLRKRALLECLGWMLSCAAAAGSLPAPAQAAGAASAERRPVPAVETCRSDSKNPVLRIVESMPFRDCADTPEMMPLPAGRFLMGELADGGQPYERPVHAVELPAFALGRYEVTFAEWDACYADRSCGKRPDDHGWGRAFHPVIEVSWVDAQQYVAWLSRKTGAHYRLPSEAEWEYAARAGTTGSYFWGDSAQDSCDYANLFDAAGHAARPNWFWSYHCLDGYTYTAPVGSFPANPWGLFDMQGNVWEWVQDCWHNDYNGAPTDGSAWVTGGDCTRRVNRGGGWGNHPRTLRAAKRDADLATGYGDAFGFRVVRELRAEERAASP